MEREDVFLQRLQKKDKNAFRELYDLYGEDLLLYAYILLNDPEMNDPETAPEKVEALFKALWEEPNLSGIKQPLYKYLVTRLTVLCRQ